MPYNPASVTIFVTKYKKNCFINTAVWKIQCTFVYPNYFNNKTISRKSIDQVEQLDIFKIHDLALINWDAMPWNCVIGIMRHASHIHPRLLKINVLATSAIKYEVWTLCAHKIEIIKHFKSIQFMQNGNEPLYLKKSRLDMTMHQCTKLIANLESKRGEKAKRAYRQTRNGLEGE